MADQPIQAISMPLYQSKGWMKLIAIVSIISGVLWALSIIGIIVAWIPIWIGVVLYQAASASEQAYSTGSSDAMLLAQNKLKSFFTIMGVFTLVVIILYALMFAWMLFFGGMAMLESMSTMPQGLPQ